MRKRRVFSLLLVSVCMVGALFLFVLPSRTYLSQRRSLDAAAVRVQVLSAENAKLDQRVQQLQTDAEIERLAREQYGLVMPGEKAYAILPPKPAPLARTGAPGPARKASHRPWWEFWG